MAIARGAGTEILRAHHFEDMDQATVIIVGVQHHIYTVLSLIVCARALDSTTDTAQLYLTGYDSHTGASAQNIHIFTQCIQVDETFVWNDKFSFNGFEPDNSAMSGDLSTVAEQDAIADQGSAVSQKLTFSMTSADAGGQDFDVHVSFIDQNNA